MSRRAAARTKKRLTCAVVIGGSRLSGIVLDLSANGLFVQTSANPPPGAELGLELELPGEPERTFLLVRVARKKVVPPRLRSVVHGGLGLRIKRAPEAYFSYVARLQCAEVAEESPAVAAAPAKASAAVTASPKKASPGRGIGARRVVPPRVPVVAKGQRFRVRVSQISGSRSRLLEVIAASEEEARRKAVGASGEGWKILACERVE